MTFRLVDSLSWIVKTDRGPSDHLIALEAVTELGPVDLENSPVLRETLLTNAETDGWGAEDVAKDAVVEFLPVLVDPIEQRSKRLHRILRLVQQPLSLNPGRLGLPNVDSVGTLLLPLFEPFNLLPPA